MASTRKWFTCTPVRFVGDHRFFARDSGLLCKGFQEIGVACKAIMPGPPMENDHAEDLIRTEYRNLENASWWKSLGAEGVVFYGWGAGKYAGIAKAIKQAGLILVSHMDTAGMLSVLNGFGDYSKSLLAVCKGEAGSPLTAHTRFAARLTYDTTLGLLTNDLTRARHLKQADLIGAITPIALERIRKVCRIYGGAALADRVQLIPHPNSRCMRYDPQSIKEPLVVAVGRWDDMKIKGTDLLMATLEILTERARDTRVEIYGSIPELMRQWHQQLPDSSRARVRLMGVIRNEALAEALQRASVSLCTSLREGYHTVSAEALCCGCSIVGPDVSEVPSMKWFTSSTCGRMASRNAESMANAILDELRAWRNGERNPLEISETWTSKLHASGIARRILDSVDALKVDSSSSENR